MAVELPADIEEGCKELGKGVGYVLKVLCRQLEDNPLLGSPLGVPSLYVAQIDGETFEDCPELNVHYAYGPPQLGEGQVQIRSVEAIQMPTVEPDVQGDDQGPDPHLEARRVTAAWQRIEAWLRAHAPASYASLKAGASEGEISALEYTLGVRVPAGLKALWSLRAGVHDMRGAGFLLDDQTLMDLDAVAAFHRQQMLLQQRNRDDEFPTWRPSWIPFCSFWVDDRSYGLYLDTDTGQLCHFSRYAERWPKYASLTVYLEEIADALDAPSLASGSKPGLAGGALVWGPPTHPDPQNPSVPYTG
ncbi:SMI1/KNR4 family protein [Streptomyces lunaelactis]|uniref:SMI1/KNR4 family protein n=1 Tax=Streptomyces lunaelactis TaxID=1535768 RepID=UPI0028163B2C|nr:SMI1/KNR4 family protein [Streptomyces lunaelactis]